MKIEEKKKNEKVYFQVLHCCKSYFIDGSSFHVSLHILSFDLFLRSFFGDESSLR